MAINLGSVQLEIMRVLWEEGDVSARRITEVLSKAKPTAHSTVQTLLRQLEAKGAVGHEQHERTFLFRALVKESEITRSAAQDLLTRVFKGSISGLVSHLLTSENISPSEMDRLRKLVEDKTREIKK